MYISKFRTNISLIQTMYFELLLVVRSLQNSDFQSQFSMSKIIGFFLKEISLLKYFENFNFKALYLLKWCQTFVGSEVV